MAHGRVSGRNPHPPVDAAALAAFAVRLLDRALHGEEFELEGPLLLARRLDGLVQMIELELGDGRLTGLFNVAVGWRIDLYEQAPGAFHVRKHLGILDDGRDRWFGKGSDDGLDEVERMIVRSALPFLTEHDSIKKLLRIYDRSSYNDQGMFGKGEGLIALHLGLCHEHEGKWDEARRHLKEAVAAKKGKGQEGVEVLAKAALARIAAEDGEQEHPRQPDPKRGGKYQRRF